MLFSRPAGRAAFRVVLTALPLLTAACADNNPSPMPSGYRFDNQQYLVSSAGPVQQMNYPGNRGPMMAASQPSMEEMTTPMMPVGTVAASPVPSGPVPVMNESAAMETAAPSAGDAAMTNAAMPGMAAAVNPQWRAAADDLMNKMEKTFGRLRDPAYIRNADPDRPGELAFMQAVTSAMEGRAQKVEMNKDKAAFAYDYQVGMPNAMGRVPLTLNLSSEGRQVASSSGEYTVTGNIAQNAPMMEPAQSQAQMQPPAASPQQMTPPAGMTQSSAMQPPAMQPPAMQAPYIQPSTMSPPVPPSAMSAPPPPPFAGMPPSPDAMAPQDVPTYVYDGRSMTGPSGGRTAYEQLRGANEQTVVPREDQTAVQ